MTMMNDDDDDVEHHFHLFIYYVVAVMLRIKYVHKIIVLRYSGGAKPKCAAAAAPRSNVEPPMNRHNRL